MKEEVERACPVCGNGYLADPIRLRHGRQTTCSRACSYRLRGNQKKTSVPVICAVCEREFTRAPSQIKGKHGSQFCSRECHYIGRGTGDSLRTVEKPYRYTDEGFARLSEAGALAYAAGVLKRPQSERVVMGILASAREPFAYQVPIIAARRTFVVDFLLHVRNVVLELDGPEHRHKGAVRDRDEELASELTARGIGLVRIPFGAADDMRSAVLQALGR